RTKNIISTVPLLLCRNEKQNKYTVKAKINGVEGEFYIDTGASDGTMTTEFAKKLSGLEMSKTTSEGIGTKANRDDFAENVQLNLGDISLPQNYLISQKVSCP